MLSGYFARIVWEPQQGGNNSFPRRRPKVLLCVTCGTLPALFGTLRYPRFTPYFPYFPCFPLCKVYFSYGMIPGEFWDQPGSVQSHCQHLAEISTVARGMAMPLCYLEIPNNWICPRRWTQRMDLSQFHHGPESPMVEGWWGFSCCNVSICVLKTWMRNFPGFANGFGTSNKHLHPFLPQIPFFEALLGEEGIFLDLCHEASLPLFQHSPEEFPADSKPAEHL